MVFLIGRLFVAKNVEKQLNIFSVAMYQGGKNEEVKSYFLDFSNGNFT